MVAESGSLTPLVREYPHHKTGRQALSAHRATAQQRVGAASSQRPCLDTAMATSNETYAVGFAQRVHENVRSWYVNADTKAQVVLGLNSALLGFLIMGVLRQQDDIAAIVDGFGWETFASLGLMLVSTAASTVCAVVCLWSRGLRRQTSARPSEQMVFFREIAHDEEGFRNALQRVDEGSELEALRAQIPAIAKNVLRKHKLVNAGFVSFGVGLGGFMLFAASYVSRA
jgi:hypothetical protein